MELMSCCIFGVVFLVFFSFFIGIFFLFFYLDFFNYSRYDNSLINGRNGRDIFFSFFFISFSNVTEDYMFISVSVFVVLV